MPILVHGKTRSELLHYIAAIKAFPMLPYGSRNGSGLCYQATHWGVADAYQFWDTLRKARGSTGRIASEWQNRINWQSVTESQRCEMRDKLVQSLLDDMRENAILEDY